jgi:hypothetical protein
MNSNLINLWKTGAYTEDTVVRTLQCSYLKFRQALVSNNEPLPDSIPSGLHFEIYREYISGVDERYDDLKWLAESYGLPLSTVSRYRTTAPVKTEPLLVTDEDIRQYLAAGFDSKTIASILNVAANRVNKLKGPKTKAAVTDATRASIVADLAKGMLHHTIAIKYNVSESLVSKLNPNKVAKPKRPPLDETDWALAKASLTRYSVSEVARMHNVSRAYIYGRLAKEKD